jgi:ABC-type cobalamin/Fe3+-siderophores transport system ATPase subunit
MDQIKKNVIKKKIFGKITLKDINIKVKKGELVCIIGNIGSGKSSLLQTIIGDLMYIDEKILAQKYELSDLQDKEKLVEL